MKVLFLCFTPYHIKVCNYLSKSKFNNDDKFMLLSSITLISEKNLQHFVNAECYNKIEYFKLVDSPREIIKKPVKYLREYRRDTKEFISVVNKFSPDLIVTFCDNSIPYQILFNEIKKNSMCKIMFVEEGVGIYLNHVKFSFKEYSVYLYRKMLYGKAGVRFFPHGKGKYEDMILAREPQLIDSEAEKIKLLSSEFKEVFVTDSKPNLNLHEGTLFCPSKSFYDKNIMLKVFEEIFIYYYNKKRCLHVKLHPAEENVTEIKKVIEKYSDYVKLIEDSRFTSEDILINEKIDEILSDFSSVLINAYYLKDDIKIVSYYNLIKEKYGVDIGYSYSIFEMFYDKGIIKSFNNY